MGEEGAAKAETRAMVAWARDEILKLLHPFMPFITEELWAVTAKRDGLLVLRRWPRKVGELDAGSAGLDVGHQPERNIRSRRSFCALDAADFSDPAAEAEIGWVVDLVTAIRSVRAEMNIPPATLTPLVLAGASAETRGARSAGTTSSSGWPGSPTFPSPIARRKARCNCWCAARSRRCRSRA